MRTTIRRPICVKSTEPLKVVLDLENMMKGGIPLGKLFTFASQGPRDEFYPRTAIAHEMVRAAIEQGKPVLYLNLEAEIECSTLRSLGLKMKRPSK